jgi:hypothetical protein
LWDSNWWPLRSKFRTWSVELHPSRLNISLNLIWLGIFYFQTGSNQNYFANTGLFRISSQNGSKLTKLNSAPMASSGLLLSTVTFIIAGSLTLGIARSKHRVVILHSSESFYFRKSPPVSIHLEVMWEIERKRIKKLIEKVKRGMPLIGRTVRHKALRLWSIDEEAANLRGTREIKNRGMGRLLNFLLVEICFCILKIF